MQRGEIGDVLYLYRKAVDDNAKLLSFEEERELGKLLHSSNVVEQNYAKEKLVVSNIKLVWSIAKNYKGRGIEFEDLVQNGVIGLMNAIEKFDEERKLKFSTYATYWIRQSISRSIQNDSAMIRKPAHIYEEIQKVSKAEQKWINENGSEPTIEELAKVTGYSKNEIVQLKSYFKETLSADKLIDEAREESASFLDMFVDEKGDGNKNAEEMFRRELVDKLLSCLTDREKEIVSLRHGFKDGYEYSYSEIGEEVGLTKERCRQIENKALKKMLNQCKEMKLKDSTFLQGMFEAKEKREEEKKNGKGKK